jgi:MoaA/NifB/PqqE/SkfB family radical SAM enzyme
MHRRAAGFVANYLLNLGALLAGREPRRPLLFSWYITHRCDLACSYCCDGDGKRFKEERIPELGTADSLRLVSILRGAGDTLDITGGEPLLRDDLEEILAHARREGFRTVLNTKGIGLPARPDLLRSADILVLSIDTLDPGRLAALIGRPPAAAGEILGCLRWALDARRRTGTRVVLSAVATPENLDDVRGVFRFALENGCGFQVSPEIAGTRANPALPGNEDYRRLVGEVLDAKRRARGVLGVPRYFQGIRDFSPFRCRPLLMPTIRPDGRLYYPCLEKKRAEIDVLAEGSYSRALAAARRRSGPIPRCGDDCCHIFCHLALGALQSSPIAALRELRHLDTRSS